VVDSVTIPWEGGEVSGRIAGTGSIGMVLAHGAGTNQDHSLMTALRDGLAAAGLRVMTFNYPYTERGSRSPDRAERLVRCHRGAADFLRPTVELLFLGGRSMGGRMATYLVAEGDEAAGVVLYAYPLHPAGKPEKLRIEHFPDVRVPLLFFQGTRDALSRVELFDRHIATLSNAKVEWLEGADHSFRGKGWSPETMVERLVAGTTDWIGQISSGRTSQSRP